MKIISFVLLFAIFLYTTASNQLIQRDIKKVKKQAARQNGRCGPYGLMCSGSHGKRSFSDSKF